MDTPELNAQQPTPQEPPTPAPAAPPPRDRRALILILGAALMIGAFAAGYLMAPRQPSPPDTAKPTSAEARHVRYYSCSMHPQIQAPQPGKCPICFMDLVPVYERAGNGDPRGLLLSRTARELAEVQTSPVAYRPLSVTVRLVGKADYDETRLAYVSAWIPGRVDRLYVDYTGIRVAKGEHLLYLYSPQLRTAQEELLIAHQRVAAATHRNRPDEIAAATAVRDAVEKKLLLWGILPDQVRQIEQSGRADDHMTIYAPAGGTVVARDVFAGKYVMEGERLFTIADLRAVWVLLDAYELDVPWLRYGQTVTFETDAHPGETFQGRIAFIPPVLNEATRTVKVRVNVPNADERLKPGMFVRARVDVTLDEAGRVKEPSLAGKWMCPMHPEIVKDAPGACDICGMDLVEAASLGFGPAAAPTRKVLSIPVTAPLLTGKRAVVYVEQVAAATDEMQYVGREIELGPRAGDYYIVVSGLQEGERVVTRGNFKIDASLQIQAKPSMMKPEGGEPPPGHRHGPAAPALPAIQPPAPAPAAPPPAPHVHDEPARPTAVPAPASLRPVLEAYLGLADALASDDAARAAAAVNALRSAVAAVQVEEASAPQREPLSRLLALLRGHLPGDTPTDIAAQRSLLARLTAPTVEVLTTFGHRFGFPLYEIFCPMAFGGQGAAWVQKDKDVRNPYFGASMLKCGEVRREFKPADGQGGPP